MATLHPFSDQLPPAREWHVIGLLPVGELVLLDGDDKVGKTLFTATLGAILSRQPDLQTPCVATKSDDTQLSRSTRSSRQDLPSRYAPRCVGKSTCPSFSLPRSA